MTTISDTWATVAAWPHWAIISAFCSGLALAVLIYVQILRPRIRRLRLKRPVKAYFIITSRDRFELAYVEQDDRQHLVRELVVPANSEITVQILLIPKLTFLQREIYFGCDESLNSKEKPYATEWFNPFVLKGVRRSGKPDADHPGHYTDYNGFYHAREDHLYTTDHRAIGFKLVTGAVGIYHAQVYLVTDEVRGRADLVIRVEQPPTTKMRCRQKSHWRCSITPLPISAKA